jgi:hypothetical protein
MELTGGDWELNHRQRVKEEQMRREAGLNDPAPDKTAGGKEEQNSDDDADGVDGKGGERE